MEVIFFPRNDYPENIAICKHRLGKKMTYCERTTLMPSYVQSTVLPYFVTKHNENGLRVGCDFMDVYLDSAWNSVYGKQCIADGVIWPDLYFYPDPFKPDGSQYTEENVVAAWNRLLPWFIGQFGSRPIAIDFSSGQGGYYKEYPILKNNLLCCDSSVTQLENNSDYGLGVGIPDDVPYTQARYYPRFMNTRVFDNARTHISDFATEKDAYDYYIGQMADLIDDTIALANGGLLINFHHWHDLVLMDYNSDGTPIPGRNDYAINNGFKPYMEMLATKNANDEIYFSGYGEAVAYLVYRQMVSKAVMFSPIHNPATQIIIRLETNNELGINTNLMQVPISVKISLESTPLSGMSVKCNRNIIPLGGDEYIVEIPFDRFPYAVIERI